MLLLTHAVTPYIWRMSSYEPQRHRSPNAVRVSRYYERQRKNRAVLQIEVELNAIAEYLVHQKFLHPWDADDRAASKHALEQYLHVAGKYPLRDES
jgi:hypothetical protein